MICPNCQTANRDTARFCLKCGTTLRQACANCGASLPRDAKFCANCGQAVATAAPVAPPAPKVSGESKRGSAGERRIVTILFCDVKGSTALAEQFDPEEWAEIMNDAFAHIIAPVERYEGTVARLMGDAILAFFGAPLAHEDDPQRAVLAGLEIVEEIRPFREDFRRQHGLDFDVRVGINTGLVMVGDVGASGFAEYTAMGDAVNLAARMEQTATPGTVQIAAATQRLVAPLFDLAPLGGIEIKGKAEPVEAFRVLGRRAEPLPLRGISGLRSPVVGREREMGQLRAALDDLLAGSGRIISLIGEAGLGKSRLKQELRAAVDERNDDAPDTPPVRWLEGRSLSYETATPYAPFIDLISRAIGPTDTARSPYDCLRATLAAVMPDEFDDIAPFMATMLGMELDHDAAERVRYLEPVQLRGRIAAAVSSYVERLASAQPVVMVLEDLHWADPTSLDLMRGLLPLAERAQILLMALFRPQRQDASWRFHEQASAEHAERYSAVTLDPLAEGDARVLVANLLTIEDLPEQVRALILARAEGNPFFVEEVIRSLLDAGLVVREGEHWRATREITSIALPDTLAGLITARLDRLPDSTRRVGQAAAVIGREFGRPILDEVYDPAEGISPALADMQQRELISRRSSATDPAYLFKHVLTQEAAYGSLLLSRRRDLHRRVGDCLERREPERVNDIARHFVEAREEVRALPYLLSCGERAARAGASAEAIRYYTQALEIAKRRDDLASARRAYEGLGNSQTIANDAAQALTTYREMQAYAEEHHDDAMKVSALNKAAQIYVMELGDFTSAEQHLDQSESLARATNNSAGLGEMFTVRCSLCVGKGDLDSSLRYMNEANQEWSKLDVREQLVWSMAHTADTLTYLGRYDEAWAKAQEGLAAAEAAGIRREQAQILIEPYTWHYLQQGDVAAARQSADEGTRISTSIGWGLNIVFGKSLSGMVAALQGDYADAIRLQEESLQVAQQYADKMPFLLGIPIPSLVQLYTETGSGDAQRVAELYKQTRELLASPWGVAIAGSAWYSLGCYSLHTGRDDAEEAFEQALSAPSIYRHLLRPANLTGAALAALAKGAPDRAAAYLAEARRLLDDNGMSYMDAELTLVEGQLAAAQGDQQAALAHYDRAERRALAMGLRPVALRARQAAAAALAAAAARKREQAQALEDELRATSLGLTTKGR